MRTSLNASQQTTLSFHNAVFSFQVLSVLLFFLILGFPPLPHAHNIIPSRSAVSHASRHRIRSHQFHPLRTRSITTVMDVHTITSAKVLEERNSASERTLRCLTTVTHNIQLRRCATKRCWLAVEPHSKCMSWRVLLGRLGPSRRPPSPPASATSALLLPLLALLSPVC